LRGSGGGTSGATASGGGTSGATASGGGCDGRGREASVASAVAAIRAHFSAPAHSRLRAPAELVGSAGHWRVRPAQGGRARVAIIAQRTSLAPSREAEEGVSAAI